MQRLAQAAIAAAALSLFAGAQEANTPDLVDLQKQFLPDRNRDQDLQAGSVDFQDFIQRHPGHWASRWNYATNTPKAVFGEGVRMSERPLRTEAEARAVADAFLARERGILGIGSSGTTEIVAAKVNRTWVFVYEQSFHDIPVIGGRLDLRINENGVVSMFGSQMLPVSRQFGIKPGIANQVAEGIAFTELDLQELNRPAQSRLTIWADFAARVPQTPTLAWEVSTDGANAAGEHVISRVYVDARTGTVLESVSDRHECSFDTPYQPTAKDIDSPLYRSALASVIRRRPIEVDMAKDAEAAPGVYTGQVQAYANTGPTATSPVVNTPLRNLTVSLPGVGSTFTDANGDFSINNGAVNNPVNATLTLRGRHLSSISSDAGATPTATATVTPGVPASFQFLAPNPSEFDLAATTTYWGVDYVNEYVRGIIVPNPSNLNTISGVSATVNINQSCNAFYSGNTINFYRRAGNCNNTAFGDVIYHEWGHGIDDAFGVITNSAGEGLSEGWGDIIATYRSGQPNMGSGFFTNGGFVRTALNTTQYANNSCGSSVHCAGQSWMGFAWQLRGRLAQTLGSSAGISRAEQIVIGSIAADARNQPDAVLEVFVMDDDDGNLNNGTPNYDDIRWAADQRNLPSPDRFLSDVTHTPLTSTTDQVGGRVVRATVTALSGSINAIRVRTDIGGSITVNDMIPASGINEFIGMIPGAVSPAVVNYTIEVDHSTGITETYPANGEYSYKIGEEDVFLTEDFETGAPGWTSVQIATQDDWQLGSPGGSSGTSSGVAWQDPSQAYNGSNCYGNDLAIGNFNGRYQPNVNNYLQSPSFSTLGKFGVTLQFARWLTVEEGIYDQATIESNGIEQWANPLNGNLLDTGWSIQEVPLTNADNQASVNLRWRLETDGGLNLGGWAIDAVRVFSFNAVPLPDVTLAILPEQVSLGAPMTLQLNGDPNQPVLVALGDTPGPTLVNNIPPILVGGSTTTVPFFFDNNGNVTVNFTAPTSPAAAGTLTYAQAISISQGQIVVSNQAINLYQ